MWNSSLDSSLDRETGQSRGSKIHYQNRLIERRSRPQTNDFDRQKTTKRAVSGERERERERAHHRQRQNSHQPNTIQYTKTRDLPKKKQTGKRSDTHKHTPTNTHEGNNSLPLRTPTNK